MRGLDAGSSAARNVSPALASAAAPTNCRRFSISFLPMKNFCLWIFGRPRIPAALDTWRPRQLFAAQCAVHAAPGERPTCASLAVFERSGLRRTVARVKGQRAVLQLVAECY